MGGFGGMGGPSHGTGDPSGNSSDHDYAGRSGIGGISGGGGGGGDGGYSMHDQAMAGLSGPEAAALGAGGTSAAADAAANKGGGGADAVDEAWAAYELEYTTKAPLVQAYKERLKSLSPHGFVFSGPRGQWGWSLGIEGLGSPVNVEQMAGVKGPYHDRISEFVRSLVVPELKPSSWITRDPLTGEDQISLSNLQTIKAAPMDDVTQDTIREALNRGVVSFTPEGTLTDNTTGQALGALGKPAANIAGKFLGELAPKVAKAASVDAAMPVAVAGLGLDALSGLTTPLGALGYMRGVVEDAVVRQALVDRGLLPARQASATPGLADSGGGEAETPAVQTAAGSYPSTGYVASVAPAVARRTVSTAATTTRKPYGLGLTSYGYSFA